jgi:hypothetical protein
MLVYHILVFTANSALMPIPLKFIQRQHQINQLFFCIRNAFDQNIKPRRNFPCPEKQHASYPPVSPVFTSQRITHNESFLLSTGPTQALRFGCARAFNLARLIVLGFFAPSFPSAVFFGFTPNVVLLTAAF